MANFRLVAACAWMAALTNLAIAQPEASSSGVPDWMSPVTRLTPKDSAKHADFVARNKLVGDMVTAATLDSFRKAGFPNTLAECALPEGQTPKVIPGHPRILVRNQPWKGGLSLAELRLRAKDQPWASVLAKSAADYKRRGEKAGAFRAGESLAAALYYLITEDESVVPGIVGSILGQKNAGYGMGGVPYICYDWIHDSKSITPETRKKLVEHLVKLAYEAVALQEGANCHDIWRHRGGGAVDPLLAGLVLAGETPDGVKLLRMGAGYYKRAFLPAYQFTGGGWLGGGHSYAGSVRHLPLAIACWNSATEDDVFEMVRRDYGNWLENHMYFWMGQVFPDKTRSESIGTNYDPWKLQIDPDVFLLISRAYRNPDGYAFLRWLGQEPKSARGLGILLYDAELDKLKPSAAMDKPWSHVWGRDGLGYAQFRSKGWKPDSTVIEFKAGKYTELHGHYSNQNSFYIFHNGRLAVQGGEYATSGVWNGGENAANYYRRTVSANSMLIYQPGEFHWYYGKAGYLPNPGQWADVFSYRSLTFDEYYWRVKNDPRYDMGSITAYECGPEFGYSYVCGDATNAYNSPRYCTWVETPDKAILANRPKIDLFTRSMVYIPDGCLIVFDRVNALDPSWRKAWLLQTMGQPRISGKLLSAEVPGHVEEFDGDTITATWPGGVCKPPEPSDPGRLIVRTFLPRERVVRRIGGRGYEFYANGRNYPGPASNQRFTYLKGDVLSYVYDEKRGEGQDFANWRIELSPAKPANFDNFLNLIYITDAKSDKAPDAKLVTAESGGMVGLAVNGWLVMFRSKAPQLGPETGGQGSATADQGGEIVYSAPGGVIEHLVVDLKREGKYRVTPGAAASPIELAASKEGTLRFATKEQGQVRIVPVP